MRAWSTPAEAAISHTRRGWVVVPVDPVSGRPARRWKHLTSTPPGSVAAWWPGPQYGPGIITGPSGLIVADLDDFAAHGTELPAGWADSGVTNGAEVLAVLADRAGEKIPATYTVRTARGGQHLYFQAPPDRVIRNSAGYNGRGVGPGVDIRGQGGLVVGAGTIRPRGTYELADDRNPVPLPRWLGELAIRRPEPAVKPQQRDPSRVTETRHGYMMAAIRAEVAILRATPRGGRNDQLNRSAFALGTLVGAGYNGKPLVTVALLEAAEDIGLIADDGEDQCRRTIASGLAAGAARPRERGPA